MPAPEEVARDFQRRQKSIVLALIAAVLGLWRRLERDRLTESWQSGVGRSIVDAMTRTQLEAAVMVPAYLRDLADAQGIAAPELRVVPEALSGVASDGRPLESLMYSPIIAFKRLLSEGVPPDEAMRRATASMTMIAATQAADAGRGAVSAGMAANRSWVSYVRVVNLPACSRCIILAGRTYSISTGFQRHPNCFPAGTAVSGPAARAATRRWYKGELVVLRTASGQELSATGNHPILTDRGWVAANRLQPGDHVVRSMLGEGAVPLVVPDERQMPARIEDLWRPDGVGRLVRMPTASQDFHGDGGHGDVDVVLADRLLRDWEFAPVPEPGHHGLFGRTVRSGYLFEATGSLAELLVGEGDSTPGGMSGARLGGSLFRGHLGGAHLARCGHVADGNALLLQPSAYDGSADAVAEAETVLALAGQVGGNDLGVGQSDAPFSRWDAPRLSGTREDRAAYARRGKDLLGRLAGQVELDRLVDLRRVEWSGHVYNLTSAEGWYAANSIIVSNCDCTMMPIRSDSETESIVSPKALFERMSPEEQDRRFGRAGAEAIRLGADLGQVVNARSGMRTAGGQIITTTGTTRRGVAGRRLRGQVRLMPETIIADAAGDRDAAIRALRENGFLLDT